MRAEHATGGGLRHREVRVFPAIGERVPVMGCYSEVMMSMKLAGKPVEVSLEYSRMLNGGIAEPRYVMAQVWKDGEKFSFPILTGEAGFYECSEGYYTYADKDRLPAEVLAQAS